MRQMIHTGARVFSVALLVLPLVGSARAIKSAPGDDEKAGTLWQEPTDTATRNLYFGPGGEADAPHAPFTFVEGDMKGTNPKYVVHDRDNVKWTVKLGLEARPETVASRLVWAVGYFADEDYFLPSIQIGGLPEHLKRGRNLIAADGSITAVRLKRHEPGKTLGEWKWRENPFIGTRELNGLKVMMALINNWDLKNENNKERTVDKQPVYFVSDLGASFGTNNLSFPFSHSKGDLTAYTRSKFIAKITDEYVDFGTPSIPNWVYLSRPWLWFPRVGLDKLLHHVPRDDARWMGNLLSCLSSSQIQDAFRAAGYTPEQVKAFSDVINSRITQLTSL